MRLGKTIGTVTLVEPHANIRGGVFRVVVPLATADLAAGDGPAEPLVAWDDLGAGEGQLVAFSEGGEAAQPFDPEDKPIDAYIAAIIDQLDIPETGEKSAAGPARPARPSRSARPSRTGSPPGRPQPKK
jgi:ethanolamine utilization protein EutN